MSPQAIDLPFTEMGLGMILIFSNPVPLHHFTPLGQLQESPFFQGQQGNQHRRVLPRITTSLSESFLMSQSDIAPHHMCHLCPLSGGFQMAWFILGIRLTL